MITAMHYLYTNKEEIKEIVDTEIKKISEKLETKGCYYNYEPPISYKIREMVWYIIETNGWIIKEAEKPNGWIIKEAEKPNGWIIKEAEKPGVFWNITIPIATIHKFITQTILYKQPSL